MSDNTIDDGGPAFPVFPDTACGHGAAVRGMSVRVWLTGQALKGLISNRGENAPLYATAKTAIDFADATIATLKELPNAQ